MAFSPYLDRAGGGSQRSYTATAIEFTPKAIEAKTEVLNSSFITQAIPRVHRFAGVVGICTVPEDRAGMDDLGWHIADFLAFRALLCGENPPPAQTWLSQCDIASLVEDKPERYVHGKDRRLVGFAAKPEMYQTAAKGLVEREDNIQVETSSKLLKEKLVMAIKGKMAILKRHKYPLVLIICGMTSLEQDVYFGQLDFDSRWTMSDLRAAIGDDINQVETIVVTPSLFSAGWQINTAFGSPPSASVRANRDNFLARQFGGLFAKDFVQNFLGWKCPVLDVAKVDHSIITSERFPGPASPSDEVKALISKLQAQIHSCLIGQFSAYYMDHSFSFDEENDEWPTLIAQREKSPDYPGLGWYEQKWSKLPSVQSFKVTDEGLPFLGSAFGGTRMSQVNHLRYLIDESYLAWPDHWATNFGQVTKADFERFLNSKTRDDLDCYEVFSVLEHRATMSTLASMIVKHFDLPMPHNQRCRDWNSLRWRDELPEADLSSLIQHFGTVLACVPGPNVPPGINPNQLSRLQRRLENAATYVRASLGIRFLTSKGSSKTAIDNIHNFIQDIKMKQAELLVSNPKIYQMCCSWLLAIDMPVRDFDTAVRAARKPQGVATPVISSGILEDDGEYEVQQVPFSKAPDPNFTMMGNPYDDFVHGQKHSSKFSAPGQEPPPVLTTLHPHYPQQHRAPSRNASGRSNTGILDDCDEYQHTSRPRPPSAIGSRGYSVEAKTLVTESPAIDTMQAEKNTILAKPDIIITKAGQDDRLGFNQDVVEHELKIARLIEALQTTNTTAKRQKLTKELLELLQSDNSLSTEEEEPTGATQDSATKAIKDETAVVAPLTKTKATSQDSGGKKQPDEARDTAKVSALKLQDPNSTLLPHQRVKRPEPSKGAVQQVAPQTPVETQQAAPRKTPPHLRFVSGRRN